MSVPAYPEYQNTGVQWLGDTPSHWVRVPFWSLFRRTKRVGHGSEELLSVYRDYGVIRKSDRDDNFNNPSDDLGSYQLVEPGDLAMNKMKAWQGSLGVSPHRGIVSPAYFVFQPLSDQNPAFLHYLLRSPPYAAGYMTVSKGIRINQWDVDPDYLDQIPVCLPTLREQAAIAAFLDRETAKIDELVEEQSRLIALLKEKRQSVISHAVTKGLDPNAPMKDSGVEWLGEVPAHWEVAKAKRFLAVVSGFAFPSDKFSQDEVDARLLRGINIGVGKIRWDESVFWRRQSDDGLDPFTLLPGQLVIGMDRPWINDGLRIAVLTADDVPALLLQRVAALNPAPNIESKFLFLLFSAQSFFHYCFPDMTGVSVPHISPTQIGDYSVAMPPIEEQRIIVDFYNRFELETQLLLTESESAISLLEERRAALISAAVTGKIDVRGLAVMSDKQAAA